MPDDASEDHAAADRRRITRFLQRAGWVLEDHPIIAMRDEETGKLPFGEFTHTVDADGRLLSSSFTFHDLTLPLPMLKALLVDCRVFFLVKEDCYLPSVVASFRRLVTPDRAQKLDDLRRYVNGLVKDGAMAGASMYSGRLGMDNGLGTGELLGSDQIAADYINGVLFHEDDERVARLDNVMSEQTVIEAVVMQVDSLLRAVEALQRQILYDIEQGYLHVEGPEHHSPFSGHDGGPAR